MEGSTLPGRQPEEGKKSMNLLAALLNKLQTRHLPKEVEELAKLAQAGLDVLRDDLERHRKELQQQLEGGLFSMETALRDAEEDTREAVSDARRRLDALERERVRNSARDAE